jgi:hypothetical protein
VVGGQQQPRTTLVRMPDSVWLGWRRPSAPTNMTCGDIEPDGPAEPSCVIADFDGWSTQTPPTTSGNRVSITLYLPFPHSPLRFRSRLSDGLKEPVPAATVNFHCN